MNRRTLGDLKAQLSKQLVLLRRSADAFDIGHEDEDIRLAQSIRVLFHQTKASHSIFGQLGGTPKMLDTSMMLIQGNLIGEMPLLQTGIGGRSGTRFFAPLSKAFRKNLIPFENWWQQLVFKHEDRIRFSRKDLVLQMANKEGGSHVDPNLTPEYEEIRIDSLGFRFGNDAGELPRNDVVSATIRQIAHEVLETLQEGYKENDREMSFGVVSMGAGLHQGNTMTTPPRNAKCICESGLKYKKCHGFALPR